eukprot:215479_1
MATKDNTQQDLQSEFDKLKQKYQSLKRDIVSLKGENVSLNRENEALKQKELEQKTETKHSLQFWLEIQNKCEQNDVQYIKSLIDSKTLSVSDVDDHFNHGFSLLHYAALNGAYEVVQLCISLGADITLQTKVGCTALQFANDKGHHAIKQLLHFTAMKANTGERIREKADDLTKQNGIIENIMNEIKSYDDTTREFFEDTLLDLVNKVVRKKVIFSDDWLCLAWKIEAKRGNVFESELWKN